MSEAEKSNAELAAELNAHIAVIEDKIRQRGYAVEVYIAIRQQGVCLGSLSFRRYKDSWHLCMVDGDDVRLLNCADLNFKVAALRCMEDLLTELKFRASAKQDALKVGIAYAQSAIELLSKNEET